ncbi:MAG: Transcriptional regulator, HxlR family [Amycolatopsis sp.]|jgi:DNA-binding HxlR family transcriptional regulator|uniref:winged helix-turn-helix transcriptional regulator n=1 Tax=Amycolatopsis sp. TaxID=37632 RepID=UPI002631695B|nr:helix-turn-helix domain-containing protein [Amycolatopsis sp.]MCU1684552.1 Transcriptional regulator, HxlR family [Amycolatopsis sp.]
MALPREYLGQSCSIARALEVVGERWSLLIVRDAFFGLRRFSDFSAHLQIPRAVLTERLEFLVGEGVLGRTPGPGRRFEYELTDKGLELWPVVRTLSQWGDAHYAPDGRRRVFVHAGCGGEPDPLGGCPVCGETVVPAAMVMVPGPGMATGPDADPISVALSLPRPLLEPVT